MSYNNLIIFPHCPKTGGTTLKERYRHDNDSFVAIDYDNTLHQDTQVVFGHTAKIGYYESQFTNKNIVYMTCLRDPIDRMMSMYNFYKTQLLYMYPNSGDVDFYLWFINKDVIRPFQGLKQYEYYLYQHVRHTEWFDSGILSPTHFEINNMYTNNVLTWDIVQDRSYVDNDKVEYYTKQKHKVEKQNMEVTWNRVINEIDHVFFQEDDIVNVFDNLMDRYNLNLIPNNEMIRTNETAYDLNKNNLSYVKFNDLDNDLRHIMELDLKYDIEFYNRCKDKWKC